MQCGSRAGRSPYRRAVKSEGLTLTWENVDLARKTVTVEDHVAKNGPRTVPLNSTVLATLKALKERALGSAVFMTQKGSKKRRTLR